MRTLLVGLAVFTFGAVAAGAAGNTASVSASTSKAGAPVALTFSLTYPMPCGNPGQSLTVRFPSSMTFPREIAPESVRVNGHRAKTVTLKGSTVSIPIARKQWLNCGLRGMGKLSIVIAPGAGLANPKRPGVYGFPIAIGHLRGIPKLRIT